METKQVPHAVSVTPSQLPQNPETPADREELPGQPQHQGDVSARDDVRIGEEPPVTTEKLPGPEVSTEPVVPLPNVHHYNARPALWVFCTTSWNEDNLWMVAVFLTTFVLLGVSILISFKSILGSSSPVSIIKYIKKIFFNKEPDSTSI